MANPTTQTALGRVTKALTATQTAHGNIIPGTKLSASQVAHGDIQAAVTKTQSGLAHIRSYNPAIAAAHGALATSTVSRIYLPQPASIIMVINRTGTSDIYLTYAEAGGAEPVDPQVGAGGTLVVPAAVAAAVKITLGSTAVSGVVVKLISAGAMAYSVETAPDGLDLIS